MEIMEFNFIYSLFRIFFYLGNLLFNFIEGFFFYLGNLPFNIECEKSNVVYSCKLKPKVSF